MERTWEHIIGQGSLRTMDRIGVFTKNVRSLELQLRTLFEDCGGAESLQLLDKLSRLTRAQQQTALKAFDHAIERLSREEAPLGDDEKAMQQFEEELYAGIVSEIARHQRKNFRVVDGKKADSDNLIDFADAVKRRDNKSA